MSDIEIRVLQKHNDQLKDHLKDQQNTIDRLETINKSHKTINGQLRTRISRLEEENKKLKDKVEDDKELIQSLYDYP
jgi:uncharacterized protein (UPF0335 family)